MAIPNTLKPLIGFNCNLFTIRVGYKLILTIDGKPHETRFVYLEEGLAKALVTSRNASIQHSTDVLVRNKARNFTCEEVLVMVFQRPLGVYYIELGGIRQFSDLENALDELDTFIATADPLAVRDFMDKHPITDPEGRIRLDVLIGNKAQALITEPPIDPPPSTEDPLGHIPRGKPCPKCGKGNMNFTDNGTARECYICGYKELEDVVVPGPTSGLPRRPETISGTEALKEFADELAKGGHPVSDKKREVSLDPPPSTDDPMGHVSQGELDRLETEEPVSQQTASRITDADDLERFPND